MKLKAICLLLLATAVVFVSAVAADDDDKRRQLQLEQEEEEFKLCERASQSCQECLETSVCDWYNPGTCSHSSMVIMDVARYSLPQQQQQSDGDSTSTSRSTNTNTNTTIVDEICQKAALDLDDEIFCYSQPDCKSCTETTLLSDGVTTCSWFAEFEFCGSESCTTMGCGETSCDAAAAPPPPVVGTEVPVRPEVPIVVDAVASNDNNNNNKDEATTNGESTTTTTTASTSTTTTSTTSDDCSSKTSCEECVSTGGDGSSDGSPFCAWVPVFYYEHYPCTSMSCDTVADPNCYSRENDSSSSSRRSASEICKQANNYYEQEEDTDIDEASANNLSSAGTFATSLPSMMTIGFVVLLLAVSVV